MSLFYNRSERRLRAFWRLLVQAAAIFFGLGLINLASALVIVLLLLLVAQIPLSQINDVQALSRSLAAGLARFPLLGGLMRLISLALVLGVYRLLARWLDRRPFRSYGFHLSPRWWADLAFGLFLGAALMALVFALERSLGWVTVAGLRRLPQGVTLFWPVLFSALMQYIYVGVNEELFSRGYQLRNMAEGLSLPRIGPRLAFLLAYLLSSSLFGLLHLGNPNASLITTANLVLAGLLLGLGYVLTGELAIPIGLHITWNFFQGNIFGLPVSGLGGQVSLLDTVQAGPAAWTGGAFGPEGGLVGVLAMLLGLAAIYAWVRLTRGRAGLRSDLAVYSPDGNSAQMPVESTGTQEERILAE